MHLGQTPVGRLRITQTLMTPLPGFALLGITAGCWVPGADVREAEMKPLVAESLTSVPPQSRHPMATSYSESKVHRRRRVRKILGGVAMAVWFVPLGVHA